MYLGVIPLKDNSVVLPKTKYYTTEEVKNNFLPSALKVVETNGFNTMNDGGGGAIYVRVNNESEAGYGKIRSTDRFTASGNYDFSNGGWWRLSSWCLVPEMVGAFSDGMDCTSLFVLLGQILTERGSGELKFVRSGNYHIFKSTTVFNDGYSYLMILENVDGIEINMNNSKLYSDYNWYTGNSRTVILFDLRNSKNIKINYTAIQEFTNEDIEFLGRGFVGVFPRENCENITINHHQVGGTRAVWYLNIQDQQQNR